VNNDPTPDEPKASSLKNILGRAVSRKALLSEFLEGYEDYLHQVNFDSVISEWKKYTLTIGRQVKIVTTREVSEGYAEDVDDEGALILKLADGSLKKLVYGDCFH
jgi:BirA family transcriptional regulator, biotin operon repressor / biotin---[acetyl-CoA-carboxylase] ligase